MTTTPERKMIDIHMHLIPGVDDGAQDLDMAQRMLFRAKEEGIRHIVATPHSSAFQWSPDAVKDSFARLSHGAKDLFPEMNLYLGCEVLCEGNRMAQIVKDLDSGKFPTMNGTDYVLTEFSMRVGPERTLHCIEALVRSGYQPIIAHMERYLYLRQNKDLVERLRDAGARIQVNAYSLFEELDESIKNWARYLVLAQKADFLGTDGHRTYHRPPKAHEGLVWLYQNCEKEYADAVARGNAEKLLLYENGAGM